MEPCVWLIGGPTASGKSDLALAWAERLGGEILNADSMQIYQGLEILSAAPDAEARRRVPHHLYGVAAPETPWSAGDWARAAGLRLAALRASGRPCVVVGGTGLYFRVLTAGLAEIPPTPEAIRAEVEALWRGEGEAAVRRRLMVGDPMGAARIASGDRQRLTRALCVLLATGRPLSAWGRSAEPVLTPGSWRGLALEPERGALRSKAHQRLQGMLLAGALEEVAGLLSRDLDPERGAMKALGVREFARAVRGEITPEQALEEAAAATRRYVKRQLTWFRHQAADWPRAEGPLDGLSRLEAIKAGG